jgi:hypothetical protein
MYSTVAYTGYKRNWKHGLFFLWFHAKEIPKYFVLEILDPVLRFVIILMA